MMVDTYLDAAASLAAIRHGRETLVAAAACPPSRHLAFAAVLGGYVAAPALPLAWRMAALVVLMIAVGLIVRWDKRRTGLFISGYRAGVTRWITAGLLVMVVPMFVLGSWWSDEAHLRWPALVMASVAMTLGYLMSQLWMRVLRRELLETGTMG